MTSVHRCPFVAREAWKGGRTSSHPSIHALSLSQNPLPGPSNQLAGWLLGLTGVHAGEDFRLSHGEIYIGSGWDSGIVLTTPDVSRRHARVNVSDACVEIEDNKSAAGLMLNGVRIDGSARVSHGDILQLGVGEFIYFDADLERGRRELSDARLSQFLKAKTCTLGWLIVSSGESSGLDFRLIRGTNRLGSLPHLEISIPDANLSSVHLTFECDTGRIYLRPDASAFELLRGTEVTQQASSLKNGDVIKIGGLELVLRCVR